MSVALAPLAAHAAAAFVAALVIVPWFRRRARAWGLVAVPNARRWHSRPTPLLGGAAIALVVGGGVVVTGTLAEVPVLVGAAACAFVVGVVDDIRSLRPASRLALEIVVAGGLLSAGLRLQWTDAVVLDGVLTVLWIVGVTNAFNLLDNMDGLCAGVTVIAAAALIAAAGADARASADATYAALLAGATAGFLVYNFSPASIFLGDGGSLPIGMSMAVLSMTLWQDGGGGSAWSVIAAPALVFVVPILDTTLVICRRVWTGHPPTEGGRDHPSHRLVAMGLSERAAVGALWFLASVGAVAGVTLRD